MPCHAVITGVLQGLHHGHEDAQQDSEEGMRCHPGNDEGPSLSGPVCLSVFVLQHGGLETMKVIPCLSLMSDCLSVCLSVLCCRVGVGVEACYLFSSSCSAFLEACQA